MTGRWWVSLGVARRSGNCQVTVRPLDVCAHEVLGVLLEHVVDLVQQIVGLLGELVATLLPAGAVTGEVVVPPPPPPRLVCS